MTTLSRHFDTTHPTDPKLSAKQVSWQATHHINVTVEDSAFSQETFNEESQYEIIYTEIQ